MKLATEDELRQHAAATRRGAIEGTLVSLAVALPGSYLLHRRWPYYRSLPPSLKALGIIFVVAPALAIQAERRGLQFDVQYNWVGAGKEQMDLKDLDAEHRWRGLSRWDKATDWAYRNQLPIFLGIWGTTMAGSWMLLRRNATQSFSQKIVQARVYAQGVALVTLLGGVALTQMHKADKKQEATKDHSWATIIDEQAREARLKQHASTA